MMKKVILVAMLLVSTANFAKCGSINLGFVTIITGTTTVVVEDGYDSNLVMQTHLETVPCSKGNRWQWFWE
jgi:hypothetical protein